jgi:hypothetical protein
LINQILDQQLPFAEAMSHEQVNAWKVYRLSWAYGGGLFELETDELELTVLNQSYQLPDATPSVRPARPTKARGWLRSLLD